MNKANGVLTDDWWNDIDKIPIGTENLERPSQWAGLLGNVLLQLSIAVGHVRFSYVSVILLLAGQAVYVAAIASAVFYEYVNGSINFSREGLCSWKLWLYLVTILVLIVVFPLLITRGLHASGLEKTLVCLATAVIAVIIATAGLFVTYTREIKRTRMQMLIVLLAIA